MKNLLTFTLALLTVLLISSCSSNTGPDVEESFEPYRIGDFVMVAPKKAKLQYADKGLNSAFKQKSDTLKIDDLNSRLIEVYHDTLVGRGHNNITIKYADSTLNTTEDTRYGEFFGDLDSLDIVRANFLFREEATESKFTVNYKCGRTLKDTTRFGISFYKSDRETHTKTHLFVFTGFQKVAETINDCPMQ